MSSVLATITTHISPLILDNLTFQVLTDHLEHSKRAKETQQNELCPK